MFFLLPLQKKRIQKRFLPRHDHTSHDSHVVAFVLPPTSHTFHEAEPFQSSLIMSLAFSAIMYAGAFV